MSSTEFKAPDESALKRMTTKSITALLEALNGMRAEKVRTIDKEIAYYEGLLKEKKAENEALKKVHRA